MESLNSGSPRDLRVVELVRRISPVVEIQAEFEVGVGKRLALVGPSGSGKTTLLRILAGIDSLDRGIILLGDQEIQKLPPEKRRVGYVPQSNPMIPTLSVIDNLACALWFRGVRKSEAREQARPWLDRIGLGAFADQRATQAVSQLSGGEQQRLAVARAFLARPSLYLLDEPFTGLDSVHRSALIGLLKEVHAEWPAPMIVISHSREDLQALQTREVSVQISQDGRVRQFLL